MRMNKGLLLIVGITVLAVGAAAWSLYHKQQRAQMARARFAVGGYTIPSSATGTHQLTQATPVETAGILRGAAATPDTDIIYSLRNIRALDNSFSTGAYVGTGKSEGHTESSHGENSYKNQDMLRNSMLAIPITVPKAVTVPKIIIAGDDWTGTSYLGGIGMPRGPQHNLMPATRGYAPMDVSGIDYFPSFPIAGAYRAGKGR